MPLILVVDDEESVRTLLRVTMEQAGYEVLECGSGKDALRQFRESPTDLVIMDIVMPEKDGLECIRELHQEFPSAKILAMTGGGAKVGTLNDLDVAVKLGARRTLQKPFALQELLQAVEDELQR